MGYLQKKGLVALALGIAVFASACVRKSAPPVIVDEIVIGEFASLTGTQGPFGRAVHQGVQLAIDEANVSGGLGGRKIRLMTYDDRGEPDEAARLVEKLATSDKALVVLGEVATKLSLAAAPIAQRLKVPMISPGSTHPDVTKAGDQIFRVCFTDPFQGAVMARFALNYLQLKKVAILYDSTTEYSTGLAEHFSREYLSGGGKEVGRAQYPGHQRDYRKPVEAVLSTRPDILFLPGYFTEVGTIAQQARKLGFKGVFLGGDGWEGEGLLAGGGGKALEGAYFSNHFSAEDRNPDVQAFVGRFRAKYESLPSALAAVGYDAARVALDGIRRAAGPSRGTVRNALAATRNFPGVTGIITISPSRDAVKPAVVQKVKAAGPHQYVTTINP